MMSNSQIGMHGGEPPMYLQRPSSARSQDVTHVLARTFRELFTRDTVAPDKVQYLKKSRGGDDDYHEKYVEALRLVQEERDRRMYDVATMERHIMQAQARAMSADERALRRIQESAQGFPETCVPRPRSHFRSCIDSSLLKKHNLISPEDFATEESPVVPAPSSPDLPSYARDTKTSSYKRTEDGSMDSPLPTFDDTISGHFPSECDSTSLPSARDNKPNTLPTMDVWKNQINAEDREVNRNKLANMQGQIDFLKNPRHIPPSAVGKSLIKPSKKKPKEFGIKTKPQKDGSSEPSAVFIASPPVVTFTDYDVGQVYEITLELKNVTTVLRPVRLIPPKTTYFSLGLGQFPGEQGLVAPGMSCHYTIRFAPDSLGDYDDIITIHTQSSAVQTVRVRAQRPAPILSLPDTLDVGDCLVNGRKIGQFTVKNQGGKGRFCILQEASWPSSNFKSVVKLGTVSVPPFEIRPPIFVLTGGESTVIEVLFEPSSVETYTETLIMVCDNCHVKRFTIQGRGQMANVELTNVDGGLADPEPGELCDVSAQHLIRMEDLNPFTYVQKNISVRNTTNVELPFEWFVIKPYLRSRDPEGSDDSIVPRERKQDVDSAFNIEPQAGLLAPGVESIFIVTFAPPEVNLYHSVLHLVLRDIPKTISAEDLESLVKQPSDPELTRKPSTTEEPAVDDLTSLEIEVKAKCDPFSLVLKPYALHFPGQILVHTATKKSFGLLNNSVSTILYQWENVSADNFILDVEPPVGELGPECEVDFEMTLSGSRPGKIDHTLLCYIQHMEDPLTLHVQAVIKGPEVVLGESDINLGLIRLGDAAIERVTLHNTSPVSAKWTIRESPTHQPPEGSGQVPSDFKFHPSSGKLKPLETKTVEVCYKPRDCTSLRTVFEVQVEDGNQSAILVRAEVQIPQVCLRKCELMITDAYLDVPVCHRVDLINQSLLSTNYQWGEPEGNHINLCTVSVEPQAGVLSSREQITANIHFIAHKLEEINDLRLPCYIDGMKSPLYLAIYAGAKGLTVSYKTLEEGIDSSDTDELLLDFGTVSLGETPKRYMYIKNHTAITAAFSIQLDYFSARPPTPPKEEIKQLGITKSGQRRAMLGRTPNIANPFSRTPAKIQADLNKAMLRDNKGAAFALLPPSGMLPPFTEQIVELTAFSDMWGDYSDRLVCKVEGLEVMYIPVKMHVTGIPLNFQVVAAHPAQQPILRFGTHVSGIPPIIRQMRINNKGPFDIRADWQVFNMIEDDKQLLDLVISYGSSFPLKDATGQEIVPVTEMIDTERSDTDNQSSGDSTLQSSREFTEEDRLQEVMSKRPKVITVNMRPHGGKQSTDPYKIIPDQIVIPAKSSTIINVSFTPFSAEAVTSDTDCVGYTLGYLSLPDQVSGVEGKVERQQGYNVSPVRLDMTAQVKPALLSLECTDEDGMTYSAAASDLMQEEQMLPNALKICGAVLNNNTETPLEFRLRANEPFLLPMRNASTAIRVSDSDMYILKPRQNMLVEVAFNLTKDLLSKVESLSKDEQNNDGIVLTEKDGQRKVHFRDNMEVEFNNKCIQALPLYATLTLPSLELSKQEVDFGPCLVGQQREKQIILCNPAGSDSYWKTTLEEKSDTCTNEVFRLSPEKGKLDAHITHISRSKVRITIFFTAKHEEEYEGVFLFKGMLGEQPRHLYVKGQGSYDGRHEAILNP